jgi:hypothetical protein
MPAGIRSLMMTAATKNRLFRNGALIILSVGFAVALGELITRAFVPVRNVGPSFTMYDSYYGTKLKENFHAKRITPEFTMTISTNSLGFRGEEPPSFPSRPVLFLGDSFTLGYGVSDGEEYPALISKKLDEYFEKGEIPVVNNGLGDNGNGRWVKFLRREGDRYRPRLVVLQVMANDFSDNVQEGLFKIAESGELVELTPKKSTVRFLQSIVESVPGLDYSYLVGLFKEAILGASIRNDGETPKESTNRDELTYRLVEQTLAICKEKQYPIFGFLVGLKGERLRKMQSVFQSRDIPIFTAPDKNERPDLYFVVDGHWSSSGHSYVADIIFSELLSRNLLNP